MNKAKRKQMLEKRKKCHGNLMHCLWAHPPRKAPSKPRTRVVNLAELEERSKPKKSFLTNIKEKIWK